MAIIGIRRRINPTIAGMVMKKTNRKEKERVSFNFSRSFSAADLDILGKTAVPKAVAKIPRGNSMSLLE